MGRDNSLAVAAGFAANRRNATEQEATKAVPITERLRAIKIGSYTVDNGSHSKHFAVRAVCEEAAVEIERLKSERAILRDSAKDVIAWCDANPPAGDALYCITRLRHAIVATEPANSNSTTDSVG